MAFGAIVLPGGIGAESDPTALKIAQNLGDLNDAATARDNLGLKELAELDIADLDLVDGAGTANDGDVLTADGLGGYGFEAPAAGGNWIREQISAAMGAPEFQTGQNYDFDLTAGGPGPFYIESILITQTGGTSGDPIDNSFARLDLYRNPGRSIPYNNASSLFMPSVLPGTVDIGDFGHDTSGADKIYLRFTDGKSGTGLTVQYTVFATIRRPGGLTDNTL